MIEDLCKQWKSANFTPIPMEIGSYKLNILIVDSCLDTREYGRFKKVVANISFKSARFILNKCIVCLVFKVYLNFI